MIYYSWQKCPEDTITVAVASPFRRKYKSFFAFLTRGGR